MGLTTGISEIGIEASEAVLRLYPVLGRNTVLLFAGLLLASAGLSVLIRALLLRKAGWIHRRSTPLKCHYTLMVLLVIFLILQAFHGLSGLSLWLFLLSAAAVCAAIFGLFTWRRFGIAAAILSLWLTLPLREIPTLIANVKDYLSLSSFSVPGKVGVYTLAVYACGRFTVFSLIAAVLSILTIAYYTKRRYLFRDSQALWFQHLACCPACGAPIVKSGNFCKYCGKPIQGRGCSMLKWKALEKDQYCANCGKNMGDHEECSDCGKPEFIGKTVKNAVKKSLGDEVKKYGTIALAAVVFLLPLLINDPLKYLTQGSAAVTNAYVDRLNEWHSDPSAAENASWLREYDEASAALYALNGRGFTVIPERLNYANEYIYIQYLDASYYQMAVMEKIDETVHRNDPAAFEGLGSYFNETMRMQQQALASGLSMITLGGNKLLAAENMVVDSFRFYTSFIPVIIRVILLFLAGTLSLGCGLYLTWKAPDPSPFASVMLTGDNTEEAAALQTKMKKAVKEERVITCLGILLAVVFLAVTAFIEARTQKAPEPTFASSMDQGFTDNAGFLIGWLSSCSTDPADALSKKDLVLQVIDDKQEALHDLTDAFIPAVSEADEEMIQRRAEARKIAGEFRTALDKVRVSLEAGLLPDKSTVSETLSLLIDGMKIDQKLKTEEAFSALEDLF